MAVDDTDRATVMTYVPTYQKERWNEHAEQLGMSQSEFVRTMVQAGRRDFEVPSVDGQTEGTTGDLEGGSADATPGVEGSKSGLQNRVVQVLSSSSYLSWEELLAALTDDIEDRLDETLQEMQAANEIRYSGRHGGYALASEER
ncbi:DUF5805 domain-containing protein [Halobellus rufus]|uniref:DUF5805 domain-containing protein n=1 Tax=Halobellus rufus TaxID=1448860 RepID=UPI000679254F|nr:DUF5805 domain-containing protein [Halobellus rufus]